MGSQVWASFSVGTIFPLDTAAAWLDVFTCLQSHKHAPSCDLYQLLLTKLTGAAIPTKLLGEPTPMPQQLPVGTQDLCLSIES